jgi:hypothetical protein
VRGTAADATPRVGRRTNVALEFDPIVAFVHGHLVVREQTCVALRRELDGFVLLVGAFVPLVLVAGTVTWWFGGRAGSGPGGSSADDPVRRF